MLLHRNIYAFTSYWLSMRYDISKLTLDMNGKTGQSLAGSLR